jgi:hypothetical protein
MARVRRIVALVCIGLVLVAAFTPGVAAHQVTIVLDPVWSVFTPPPRTFVRPECAPCDEQTVALLVVLFSRPPPALA